MNLKILTIVIALSTTMSATAQKKGKVKTKRSTTTVVESPGLKLYKSMIPSTAKLMFVDSVVVDKKDFLSKIPLISEAGKLTMRDTLHSQYLNEFGDRLIFAHGDSTSSALYSADKLADRWSSPTPLFKKSEGIERANYPYLMADGVTLYFAAQGENSMGGYDIFMSTFDLDKGVFYSPENIGLPFNSTANDYLLAIDDINHLGWLVTDRRQPEDKVCIYTFVPTASRQGFEDTNLTNVEIERYSRILSIADTWKFGNRKAAMVKLSDIKKQIASKIVKSLSSNKFVINDNTVYSSANDFKSAAAKEMYRQWKDKTNTLESLSSKLDEARKNYGESSNKSADAYKIRTLENKQESLFNEIKQLEKNIRSTELNNH